MSRAILTYVSITPEPRPRLPRVSSPLFRLSSHELQVCKALHIDPHSLKSTPKPSDLHSLRKWEETESKRRENLRLIRQMTDKKRDFDSEPSRKRENNREDVSFLIDRFRGVMRPVWKGAIRLKRREMMKKQEELERKRREIVGKIRGVKAIIAPYAKEQLVYFEYFTVTTEVAGGTTRLATGS